jgi:NNP family nitrate/nitrite transporter-like MFS transporter
MGFKVQTLWQAPEINPVNGKARSIPILNPFNKYGRVFFFSWFGFSKFKHYACGEALSGQYG